MTIENTTTSTEMRFRLASGEIAAEVSGTPGAPLVIGVPGLSANLRSFDVVFAALDPARHRMIAFDPRGRGKSEKTPAGTFGWPAHARDIVDMADQLGYQKFSLLGWSMGAWIVLKACELYPDRVERIVLVDGGGVPDASSVAPVYAGLERLNAVYPSFEEFSRLARSIGTYEPWEPWERLFEYEFEPVEGGIRARTDSTGPWEDENHRKEQDAYALWQHVRVPSLVVMASRPIMPGLGHIWTRADHEKFLAEVPGSTGVEVDTNHYVVGMHPDTSAAIRAFLEE